MQHFSHEDVRVERVWLGEETGTKLVVHHILSDITVERVIGFEEGVVTAVSCW